MCSRSSAPPNAPAPLLCPSAAPVSLAAPWQASRGSSVVPAAPAAHSSACDGLCAAPEAPAAPWWVCGGVHGRRAEADPLRLAAAMSSRDAGGLCGGRWSGSSASSVACTTAALGRVPGLYAVQDRHRSTTPCGHSSGTLQKNHILSLSRA